MDGANEREREREGGFSLCSVGSPGRLACVSFLLTLARVFDIVDVCGACAEIEVVADFSPIRSVSNRDCVIIRTLGTSVLPVCGDRACNRFVITGFAGLLFEA